MDADEEPRMSGALLPRDGDNIEPIEPATAKLNSESDDAQLLVVDHPLTKGSKRERSASLPEEEEEDDENGDADAKADSKGEGAGENGTPLAVKPLSKNQLKKLKRQQKWEDGRDNRKRRRKEKRISKQAQRRAAKEANGGAQTSAENEDGTATTAGTPDAHNTPKEHALVPVSIIMDCDFETYMRETELISLSSQITRVYAANRAAKRKVRIYVSSWGGKLRTRYETLLANQHKRWNNVFFLEDDFEAAARQAEEAMRGPDGGTVVDVLKAKDDEASSKGGDGGETPKAVESTPQAAAAADAPAADAPADADNLHPSVVYLTSDSPNTLTRLEPYTSYVIGGIVDKNREKGLCYARAQERGIRTAKLPVGDYMVMASRQVLTTNHVVEIMLHWLETGDWATAFSIVIPKRKGGHLRELSEKATGEKMEDRTAVDGGVDGQEDGDSAMQEVVQANGAGGDADTSSGEKATDGVL
ncbi:tRNA m g methyltransferase domain containing protein [Niveomyces insectorum RCEF 264]|uniref:tRNA (guanine(9)-N1)-methyltransferase n=1 Tax=Niveomyces insectorum RCEF 264 TaxID=1081102 RepID=A0A162MNU5_9HYPO|nr:tRNA m g methyltransferase domain containing protein [Niveomyces insectorum RCEF 264]